MLFPVKFKVAVVGLVVAGGAAAALALGPAGLAVGQSSPPTSQSVQVQVATSSPATLVANGAEVDVSVTASCSGQTVDSAFVQVSLTESVDGDLANGVGSTTINCTGASQTADVVVVAFTSNPVGTPSTVPLQQFTKGPVIADTLIQACTASFTCASQENFPVIKIRK